ncbi:unnamed protein product [Moneuplotes crassus]|uniref:Uncharacterized protein n=1 Tax=Euplotes crassus TaxID=5936 RepID=A0AAD1X3H1_EUPCR|nr:unnamed protein product [Moneuplotes crassus]
MPKHRNRKRHSRKKTKTKSLVVHQEKQFKAISSVMFPPQREDQKEDKLLREKRAGKPEGIQRVSLRIANDMDVYKSKISQVLMKRKKKMEDPYMSRMESESWDTERMDSASDFYDPKCDTLPNNLVIRPRYSELPKTPLKPSNSLSPPKISKSIAQTFLNPSNIPSKMPQKALNSSIPTNFLRNTHLSHNKIKNCSSIPVPELGISQKFLSQEQISKNLFLTKIDHDIRSFKLNFESQNDLEGVKNKTSLVPRWPLKEEIRENLEERKESVEIKQDFGNKGSSYYRAEEVKWNKRKFQDEYKKQIDLIKVNKIDLIPTEIQDRRNETRLKISYNRSLQPSPFVTAQKKKLKGNNLFMKTYDDSKMYFREHNKKKDTLRTALGSKLQVVNYSSLAKKSHSISTPDINETKIDSESIKESETTKDMQNPPSVVYQKFRITVSKNHSELRKNLMSHKKQKVLKSKRKKHLPMLPSLSKGLKGIKSTSKPSISEKIEQEFHKFPSKPPSHLNSGQISPQKSDQLHLHQSNSAADYLCQVAQEPSQVTFNINCGAKPSRGFSQGNVKDQFLPMSKSFTKKID